MDERVFDISKPHHSKPHGTAKPVIVGHHPQMPDPMLREHAPDKPTTGSLPGTDTPMDNLPTEGPADTANVPPVSGADNFMEQPQTDSLPTSKLPDISPQPIVHGPSGLHQAAELGSHSGAPADQTSLPTGQAGWHPSSELPIPAHHGHHVSSRSRKKLPLIVLAAVIVLMGVYAAIDAGLILSGTNLPFHIFGEDDGTTEQTATPAQPSSASTLPAGFAAYRLEDTDISFAYPVSWGLPNTVADPGFSKRGGSNQSDTTYAYLVNFANNKDVQVAVTSGQFLPAVRPALYYDFQRWCSGTADGKLYKQILHFSTANSVDTPTTVTCDQGPLADASKLDNGVIVQLKTTNPDGTPLGDLYTANLNGNDWPVLRVRDVTSANAELIKLLLASVKS
ncbi:hypothetical protein A3E49_03045 [Candidatus Saccharibacteria bacterium RIFCSPHIGHO2_12_FULL_49_19]|nr:MAG: hypothetical protein A3E49_03045 [Candidatus Saccharibacteria bacterium RIFCSPHIGHO2_12_FULL_49_19]